MPGRNAHEWRDFAGTAAFALLAGAVLLLLYLFLVTGGTHPRLYDFHTFWLAGRDYLHGRDPYPAAIRGNIARGDWFVYPAPVAALFAPLGALPYSVAAALMTVFLVVAAGAAFWLVGVRDWRCYTLAFASVALLKGLNLGTVTPLLMLAVAGAWRLRRTRDWRLPVVLAAAVLLKLFLWPFVIWFFATGRRRQSLRSVLIVVGAGVLAWLPIGGSLLHYPRLLHQLASHEAWSGYGVAGLAAAAGLAHPETALVATAAAPIAGVIAWLAGRHLPERPAFATTLVVAVVASPVVWAHYLALGSLAIAVCSPALSVAWLAPLVLWLIPGQQAWGSSWRVLIALAFLAIPLAFVRRSRSDPTGRARHRPAALA